MRIVNVIFYIFVTIKTLKTYVCVVVDCRCTF